MKMKTLSDFKFKDKKVLLRTDINSDVIKGRVLFSERIKEAAKTIIELKRKKAKVIVIAHQGNPGKDDFLSLRQHAKFLNKFVKISYVPDVVGEKAIKSIKRLKPGEAILLDNLRFLEEEQDISKKPNRILKLAELSDIYINDAFSVCHRKHGSIVLLPKIMKKKCAGLLLEKEISALKKISIPDCLYLLGGAKPEENIKLLKGKKVLAGGLFGQVCLISLGKNLGYQNNFLKKATLIEGDFNDFLGKLRNKLANVRKVNCTLQGTDSCSQLSFSEHPKNLEGFSDVETPIDFAVDKNGERCELSLEDFPSEYEIEDIGALTLKKYIEIIKKAKAIFMKGPFGNTSIKKYAKGTIEILKTISKSNAFSLIGGGHLSDAIKMSGINPKKFSHISLSGGALLNYVAGEKLPGLEALGI